MHVGSRERVLLEHIFLLAFPLLQVEELLAGLDLLVFQFFVEVFTLDFECLYFDLAVLQ